MNEHPCMASWKSDLRAWTGLAHTHVKRAAVLKPGIGRNYNIRAAEKMIAAAEKCLKKIKEVSWTH